MTPVDIGRWHDHFMDWPPGGVVDYLRWASEVDKKERPKLDKLMPGAARWLGVTSG